MKVSVCRFRTEEERELYSHLSRYSVIGIDFYPSQVEVSHESDGCTILDMKGLPNLKGIKKLKQLMENKTDCWAACYLSDDDEAAIDDKLRVFVSSRNITFVSTESSMNGDEMKHSISIFMNPV